MIENVNKYKAAIGEKSAQQLDTISKLVVKLFKIANIKKVYVEKCIHWSIEFIAHNYDIVLEYDQPIGSNTATVSMGWTDQTGRIILNYVLQVVDGQPIDAIKPVIPKDGEYELDEYTVSLSLKSELCIARDIGFMEYSSTEFDSILNTQLEKCRRERMG